MLVRLSAALREEATTMVTKTATRHGFAPAFLARANHLAGLGTRGYSPKIRRRLKSLNVGAFAVAVSCVLFALTYALEDAAIYRDAIFLNLALMLIALSTPAFHRINEIAAPVFIALSFLFGLFVLVELVGRQSGIQINFIATSAAVFLIFDLKRLPLMAFLIALAIALHIACWLLFPEGLIGGPVRDAFLMRLYITTVVTISVIIAVLVYYAFRTAEQAEAETEALLHRILPVEVAERLKAEPDAPISDTFGEAAVLFSDIVGFVPIARSLGAARTVAMLNDLVLGFDELAARHGVEKIKTIGDAYMAAAGIPRPTPNSASRVARMALGMQSIADKTGARFAVRLELRIGIALGPVMAGVIGAQRFGYDIWGDAVNLAARLESSGKPGKIQVSKTFRDALAAEFPFAPRGVREMKGLGSVETFYLLPPGMSPVGPA
jgi:adenylate cyclase